MREILFRGKSVHTGEWMYGSLIDFRNGQFAITVDHTEPTFICVEPETIGQYTDLEDKKRKKIFEGDIIHSENWLPKKYKVIFYDGEFGFIHQGASPGYINQIHYANDFEIIGNIHDNPELMGKEATIG